MLINLKKVGQRLLLSKLQHFGILLHWIGIGFRVGTRMSKQQSPNSRPGPQQHNDWAYLHNDRILQRRDPLGTCPLLDSRINASSRSVGCLASHQLTWWGSRVQARFKWRSSRQLLFQQGTSLDWPQWRQIWRLEWLSCNFVRWFGLLRSNIHQSSHKGRLHWHRSPCWWSERMWSWRIQGKQKLNFISLSFSSMYVVSFQLGWVEMGLEEGLVSVNSGNLSDYAAQMFYPLTGTNDHWVRKLKIIIHL